MKILRGTAETFIDARAHFYPSELHLLNPKKKISVPDLATSYGIIHGEATLKFGKNKVSLNGDYVFSLAAGEIECQKGKVAVFTRFGYRGINNLGSEVEALGRLNYIDGCTDSLLIYPPRKGDPCVSSLFFPKKTSQTEHSHPSIRLGYVLRGEGVADLGHEQKALKTGDAFCIDAFERHRFKTTSSEMVVVAYHPDSDWGPTDETHPMINRTYLEK